MATLAFAATDRCLLIDCFDTLEPSMGLVAMKLFLHDAEALVLTGLAICCRYRQHIKKGKVPTKLWMHLKMPDNVRHDATESISAATKQFS